MPRPSKTIRRQIVNAGLDYKRGNREDAYKAWEAAAKNRKERAEAKRNKKQKAADAAKAAEGEGS
ncbi:MAG TPA: hypothetical protein P5572_05660 [Phycisphaerae bacterium]|nr:hypothetical protein [Phycisphaerae bacterium]